MRACEQCGGPAFDRLCTYCNGRRARTVETVLTAEQWDEHMRAAAARSGEILREKTRSEKARGYPSKPGLEALAHLLTAFAIVQSVPELPSFEWYVSRVLDLPPMWRGD